MFYKIQNQLQTLEDCIYRHERLPKEMVLLHYYQDRQVSKLQFPRVLNINGKIKFE